MFSVVGIVVLELRNLKVQMPVVIDADHLPLQNVFQLLQIHDESRGRIDVARHSNLKRVIVTVTIAIRAFAEDALVLFRRPRVVPVDSGRRRIRLCG